MTSFMDSIKSEAKKYGGGSGNSDFFQFEEGVNRMRILVQPTVIAFHFFGEGQKPDVCVGIDEGCKYHGEGAIKDKDGKEKKPSIKLATYIIDRVDNKVKLAELPLSISYSLNDLQEDSDFAFEEFPMPYDVKITHDPKNPDPKAKYRLVASPKQEELTEEEMKSFEEAHTKMSPETYVQIRKDKQTSLTKTDGKMPDYPEADPEPVPF